MKKALVLVAHGSRRESSNQEVLALADVLAQRVTQEYSCVIAAFLELAAPSIPEALSQAADQGCGVIRVFPYFLAAGKHVIRDVPEEVERFSRVRPEVEIEWIDYLGKQPGLMDMLVEAIT